MEKFRLGWLAVLFCTGLLGGCLQQDYRKAASNYQTEMNSGRWEAAAVIAKTQGKIDAQGKTKDLIWALNGGIASVQSGDQKNAIARFDQAEDLMKFDDLSGFTKSLASGVGSVLVNDTLRDYPFTAYDAIMVNSYKGQAFLLARNPNDARVEFNRTAERQRLAVERFEAEIKAEKAKQEKEARNNPKVDTNQTLNKAKQDKAVDASMRTLDSMAVYAPFVNPYTSYLRGIFLVGSGEVASDIEKGLSDLKSVREMIGSNATIDSDIDYANRLANGAKLGRRVWLVFENGQSPIFEEEMFSSLVFVGSGIINMQFAVPKLKVQNRAYDRLLISGEGISETATVTVTDFDRVVADEFKRRYPMILTRAILSAAYKTVIQGVGAAVAAEGKREKDAATQAVGLLFNLAGAVFTAATTAADTRSWIALPKEFQAVGFTPPANGIVQIKTPQGLLLTTVQLPASGNAIIFLKMQSPFATVKPQVAKLN